MPHNMYLHSALVLSRDVDRSQPAKVREANFYFSIEAAVALFVSFLINLVVVCVFAAAFFDPTCAESGTAKWPQTGDCQPVGLAEAGEALQGALGGAAQTVWAIGLLAAGQSSTMTGTYAGQFVFGGFWDLQIAPWKRVAFTRAIALVPAVLVAILSSTNSALADTLDQYLNILQSIQLPFAVLPLLRFTSAASIMGQFVNSRWLSGTAWSLSGLFIATNFYLVGDFLVTPDSPIPHEVWFYVVVGVVAVAYISFIVYLIWEDVLQVWDWMRGRERRQRKWEANAAALLTAKLAVNGDSDSGEEKKTHNGEWEEGEVDDPDVY
jgi:Mn2+/Fe2+ NRAMP family transporter